LPQKTLVPLAASFKLDGIATISRESSREWITKAKPLQGNQTRVGWISRKPSRSGRGGSFFLTSLFIELIEGFAGARSGSNYCGDNSAEPNEDKEDAMTITKRQAKANADADEAMHMLQIARGPRSPAQKEAAWTIIQGWLDSLGKLVTAREEQILKVGWECGSFALGEFSFKEAIERYLNTERELAKDLRRRAADFAAKKLRWLAKFEAARLEGIGVTKAAVKAGEEVGLKRRQSLVYLQEWNEDPEKFSAVRG